MQIKIHAHLDYQLSQPTDILLQVEAAMIPEQTIDDAHIDLPKLEHFARVTGHDGIGDRIWLRAEGRLIVDYTSTVTINRILADVSTLPRIEPHLLPGETVQYMMPSRFCQSDQFQTFVASQFGGLEGGQRVAAIRDWVSSHFDYVPGVSTGSTTALDTFVKRQGVCRDYAHVMVTLVRACGIPARVAAVYALGVEPQDFHAVAEVFLGGEWHLVDATGMAREGGMAKIGVGRDAADVAFLTAYGAVKMNNQSVEVEPA
ncbi:transglutaminase-like domain-containing protein [Sphingomonas jatrophae]|uniref:Transglutaminase-like enzyme, putative cysteine protease n=1 Tax=Sphingomonas jatrophae TaxID=1166337 RepID=A0A1I6MA21_9SPHN|nr:transglutaminase family protein [Sphingomonas jatrophae]SFS12463.1 Transglutaminase-like enzyme, putative cysteine protease [Sphingomonas jatrophae]